ncbi:MAG: cob(I)yrinic acid a,c-diamide adenosyltransferase [Nitrososphaerota archaeon]
MAMGRHGLGDSGETFLLTGEKVSKDDERLEVLGQIDELSSLIGIVISHLNIEDKDISEILMSIQEHLFIIGYHIASLGRHDLKNSEEVLKSLKYLEDVIARYEPRLPPLKKFIFLTGVPVATFIFYARAVARRVERRIVSLSKKYDVEPNILAYINRLSTLLFILGRYVNRKNNYVEREWSMKNSGQ